MSQQSTSRNLKVHHTSRHQKELMKGSKGSTQRVVKNAKTARPYAEWIKATITAKHLHQGSSHWLWSTRRFSIMTTSPRLVSRPMTGGT